MTQVAIGSIESGTTVALCLSPIAFPNFKVEDSYGIEIAIPDVPFPDGESRSVEATATIGTLGLHVSAVVAALEESP